MNLITYRAFIREKKAELIRLFSAAYQKEIDFDFADWHLNKLLTVQDGRICCEEPTGRAVYISYLEKNFHFSAFPTRPMFIGGNRDLKLYFTGEVEGDLVVDLCVITYDEQNKLSVERTAINKCRIVRLPEEARYIRIALLVNGQGSFVPRHISIASTQPPAGLDFLENITANEPFPKDLSDLKIACIFDEFTNECYRNMCKLIPFTPDNWLETLCKAQPHLLMVESAWHGNGDAWNKMIATQKGSNREELAKMVNWCRDNGIPTVFWNKEDPYHFEDFVESARLFDYVFTTAAECIDDYKQRLGHENVFALPFAAQPNIHNPIKILPARIPKACFAGTFYRNKYEERRRDITNLLNACKDFGLAIYDRNYYRDDENLKFPEEFAPYIEGCLKVDELALAFKGYKVMINVSTIKDSPTMFARRVFEGMASGTPVLSSYMRGAEELFGEGVVLATDDPEEMRAGIEKLMTDQEAYEKTALRALRTVLNGHTYADRMRTVLHCLGAPTAPHAPTVTVIAFAGCAEALSKAVQMFQAQACPHKQLVLLLEHFPGITELLAQHECENIKGYIGSCMDKHDFLSEIADSDYIACFDSRNFYGQYYLSDLLDARLFGDIQILGKCAYFTAKNNELSTEGADREYIYVSDILPDRCVLETSVFNGMRLADVLRMFRERESLEFLFNKGARMLSTDKYNFIEAMYDYPKDAIQYNISIDLQNAVEI